MGALRAGRGTHPRKAFMDPLVFTGIRFSDDSRVKLEALIDPAILTSLMALRTARKIKPENTAHFLGAIIGEAVASLTHRGLVERPEKASTQMVRWTAGKLLTMGEEWVSQSRLTVMSGLSQPTVRLALMDLRAGDLFDQMAGPDPVTGRAMFLYRLTPKGILSASKDHPEEGIRFCLGGLLPEALDPVSAHK